MTSCIVLGDAVVHEILIGLSKDEVLEFLGYTATSLKEFSVGNERSYQPHPAVVNCPDGRMNLFRPFSTPRGVGVKIVVNPAEALRKEQLDMDQAAKNKLMGLHGILALCDVNGFPTGLINAEEVTGYRTTLSAMILYVHRQNTANVVVFGAGKQALWHMRIALALRGSEIERITVVNRSAERTKALLDQIKEENDSRWKASVDFDSIQPSDNSRLETALTEADVVFCTTPSTEILFPATVFAGKEKGRYVSAIGSWQASMIELDPELLQLAAKKEDSDGLVVVDDRDECAKSTGEIVQSGLGDDKITEVGQILDLIEKPENERQERIKECLQTGLLVYKSVGVSVTDLSAGQALLAMAKKRGLGVTVPDF